MISLERGEGEARQNQTEFADDGTIGCAELFLSHCSNTNSLVLASTIDDRVGDVRLSETYDFRHSRLNPVIFGKLRSAPD